jgi:uncharacterized membrane protein SpoIIM required for sporulation
VKVDAFIASRREGWDELAELIRTAGRRAERLGPQRVRRLGALYRATAADLALARRRFPHDPVVERLEELVGRARHLVYAAPTSRGSALAFFSRDYWRLVADARVALVIAAALLFLPSGLAAAWALDDPGAAVGLVPERFRAPAGERPWRQFDPSEQAAFTTAIFTNNIRVTLGAFAGGVAAAIPTVLLLVYNGLLLGAVGGLMIGAGNAAGFVELVTAHGVLELTCIVVAGAAGLRLGWAIVDPGRLTRAASALREGRRSLAMALGTAPWLVIAGIIEGFRAQLAGLGVPIVIAVGLTFGVLYWSLVLWRGRSATDEREPWPAGMR